MQRDVALPVWEVPVKSYLPISKAFFSGKFKSRLRRRTSGRSCTSGPYSSTIAVKEQLTLHLFSPFFSHLEGGASDIGAKILHVQYDTGQA